MRKDKPIIVALDVFNRHIMLNKNEEIKKEGLTVYPLALEPLAIMVNEKASNTLESVSAYAAGKGIYLQTNSPWIDQSIVNVFKAESSKTKIVMEVEDAGWAAIHAAAERNPSRRQPSPRPTAWVASTRSAASAMPESCCTHSTTSRVW